MFYLPLFHRFEGRDCLVIGGGLTALRKLRWLVRTGAHVTVLAPEIAPEIVKLQLEHNIKLQQQKFHPDAMAPEFALVICATNAEGVSEQAFAIAQSRGQWINCVDRTDLCSVIFPAIIDRWPILVAVSSMGQSPTLSRTVRGWLEQRLPLGLGLLADLAGRLRDEVKQRLPDVDARKAFWEQVFSGASAETAMQGDLAKAEALALQHLQKTARHGRVVLVGAGPGDADLITVKGMRAIQNADVILYDKLANSELLNYARRDAELIDVGKQGPRDAQPQVLRRGGTEVQQQINALILQHALEGKTVVRLKGGDPYIFGRGGEEQVLAQHANIEFSVIPGITAAMGAASYCGIPLTHRGLIQSVRFVTGHSVKQAEHVDWPELARGDQTLVIYMALVGIAKIVAHLVNAGRSGQTPAVLIENATLSNQRSVFAALEDLPTAVVEQEVVGPSVIIVGEVVSLAPAYTAVTAL